MINQPVFCITSDIDWASSFCTADLLDLLDQYDVTPTLFATHDCPTVQSFARAHPNDVGIHPNFRRGSTQGPDAVGIVDNLLGLYPTAKTFRSHAFHDSSDILQDISRRGIRYDSNLCLYLQPDIVPLQLGVPGLTRFPVFWEDDCHWMQGGEWDLSKYLDAFTTPGIKIINVHPFIIATNAPSAEYYAQVKEHIPTLAQQDIDAVRHRGPGARTFLIEVLEFLRNRGLRCHTLHELHQMFPVKSFLVTSEEAKGRHTDHSDEEYHQYWRMGDAEKQQFLKASYQQRSAGDPYATSRDIHARELEIQAMAGSLSGKGSILDLGCGNGHTLLSLAKLLEDWPLIGVDFADSLVQGAREQLEQQRSRLKSFPSFICDDAIRYLGDLPDDSLDYVITERFIQNLPSLQWQKNVVQQVCRALRPGGRFIMCEGSAAGFAHLNEVRKQLGLTVIPDTSADNISAIRIVDEDFERFVAGETRFNLVDKLGFSAFFLISRVLHPLMVAPLKPRFDSKYNEYARLIQAHSALTPGYGSNTIWVLQKE